MLKTLSRNNFQSLILIFEFSTSLRDKPFSLLLHYSTRRISLAHCDKSVLDRNRLQFWTKSSETKIKTLVPIARNSNFRKQLLKTNQMLLIFRFIIKYPTKLYTRVFYLFWTVRENLKS